jgi:hypothetical protein
MANVGFSIFGRPEGQEALVNGLFQEAKLGSTMYLGGLTDGVVLEPNESAAIIRQVSDHSGKSSGITIVGIFQYAESFGPSNRPGGFVGSAVCFKGFPHPSLIQKGLFALLGAATKLIDPTSAKFLTNSKAEWNIELPEPKDQWCVQNPDIKQHGTKKKDRIVVEIDGALQQNLLGAVQGILSNYGYNSHETVIVTTKNGFHGRLQEKGIPSFPLLELLNYQDLHAHFNKKFVEFQSNVDEQVKALKTQEESAKSDVEKLNKEIEKLDGEKDSANRQLKALEESEKQAQKATIEASKRSEGAKEELEKANSKLTGLKEIYKTKIKDHPDFKSAVKEVAQRELQQYQQKIEQNKEGRISVQADSVQGMFTKPRFVLLYSLLLIVATAAGVYFFLRKGAEDAPGEPTVQTIPTPTENDATTDIANQTPPASRSVVELLALSLPGSDSVNTATEAYITALGQITIADTADVPAELKQFLLRNWNFAELSCRKDTVQNGTKLFEAAAKLYAQYGRDTAWSVSKPLQSNFNCAGLSPAENDSVKSILNNSLFFIDVGDKEIDFETLKFESEKPEEMLAVYLLNPNNIYGVYGIKKDPGSNKILQQHFMWMVYALSKYEQDAAGQLITPTKPKHKLPLIKQ